MKIKFVTLNIWDGGRLFDNVVDFIKKEQPDIILMQEVYDGKNSKLEKRFRTVELFKKELRFPYSTFSSAFIDTQPIGDIEQGNAVFAKFPILNKKVVFLDKPYGKYDSQNPENFGLLPSMLQHAIILLDSVELNVFNIHGIWGIDGRDNDKRLNMSKIIANEIRDKSNVILAGDFNVEPNTRTIQSIEKYLKNVFKDQLSTTFNIKRKKVVGGYVTSVVDMILVSKNVKVLEHHCPKVDVSDHLPLVCTLKI